MMLLISMAIMVAYSASIATGLNWLDLEFSWELAALVAIKLAGLAAGAVELGFRPVVALAPRVRRAELCARRVQGRCMPCPRHFAHRHTDHLRV